MAVAELEHFSQAADQCNVSQPTLSGQIKKLEEELDVLLFERTNRRVMLTEAGQHVFRSAQRILNEVDTIYRTAQSKQDPLMGKFRLGAFPTISTYLFPSLVQQVKTAMPNLRLILKEEKTPILFDDLRYGRIDAALLVLPVHDQSLSSLKLFVDDFYLAVSPGHELTKHTTIEQKDLWQHNPLLLEEWRSLRNQTSPICNSDEEQDYRATGLESLRQMVKAGIGITIVPKIAMQENETGIEYIPFVPPVPSRTIGLVWRKSSSKAVVIEFLSQAILKSSGLA